MIRRLFFAVCLSVAVSGCACFNRENTPLVNAVDKRLVPESTTAKVFTAPLVVPVGITAGILDIFVVHPVSVISDSTHDTLDLLWKCRSGGYVTKAGSTIPLVALTPVVFTGDWLARSVFDISRRGRPQQENKPPTIDKDALLKLTPTEIRDSLAKGDTKRVDDWCSAAQTDSGRDHSDGMRVVFEDSRPGTPASDTALNYLSWTRYPTNEAYLVDLLKAHKVSSKEGYIISRLVQKKSVLCSHYLMERLTTADLPAAKATEYLRHILNIGNGDDVAAVLQRVMGRPPATGQVTSEAK